MPGLIEIVIVLVIAGLLLWVVQQLPLDPAIVRIIRVVVIVFVVVWLLYLLLAVAGPYSLPGFPSRR